MRTLTELSELHQSSAADLEFECWVVSNITLLLLIVSGGTAPSAICKISIKAQGLARDGNPKAVQARPPSSTMQESIFEAV